MTHVQCIWEWPLACLLPNAGGSDRRERNKRILKKGAAMFGITTETLRQFSLAEILLLIAMNIETTRLASENCVRLSTGTTLSA
jgi:hypothetical protein